MPAFHFGDSDKAGVMREAQVGVRTVCRIDMVATYTSRLVTHALLVVAAPRLALGASSFAERCSICLSYAAVAAREGFEPTPGAINSRVPYQLGDLAAVRKERESNPQGLRSPGFQPGAVARRLALPYAARRQLSVRRAGSLCLLYSTVKVPVAGRSGRI